MIEMVKNKVNGICKYYACFENFNTSLMGFETKIFRPAFRGANHYAGGRTGGTSFKCGKKCQHHTVYMPNIMSHVNSRVVIPSTDEFYFKGERIWSQKTNITTSSTSSVDHMSQKQLLSNNGFRTSCVQVVWTSEAINHTFLRWILSAIESLMNPWNNIQMMLHWSSLLRDYVNDVVLQSGCSILFWVQYQETKMTANNDFGAGVGWGWGVGGDIF